MSVLFQQQVLERRAENVRRYRSCDRKEFQCVSTLTTNECSGRSEGDTRPRSSVMMSRGHRVRAGRGIRFSLKGLTNTNKTQIRIKGSLIFVRR